MLLEDRARLNGGPLSEIPPPRCPSHLVRVKLRLTEILITLNLVYP